MGGGGREGWSKNFVVLKLQPAFEKKQKTKKTKTKTKKKQKKNSSFSSNLCGITGVVWNP